MSVTNPKSSQSSIKALSRWSKRIVPGLLLGLLTGCAAQSSVGIDYCLTAKTIHPNKQDILTDLTAWQIINEHCKRVRLCGDKDPDLLCDKPLEIVG